MSGACTSTTVELKPLVRLVAVPAILLAFASSAVAAAKEYQFDSWTTENGLPQNSINDILQTRDGYLWLATFGGLVRFDGVRFVVFDRSFEGIGSQRLRALHEDRRGTLWAASEDGMLIRYRDGHFNTFSSQDGLPHAGAIRIEEDRFGFEPEIVAKVARLGCRVYEAGVSCARRTHAEG